MSASSSPGAPTPNPTSPKAAVKGAPGPSKDAGIGAPTGGTGAATVGGLSLLAPGGVDWSGGLAPPELDISPPTHRGLSLEPDAGSLREARFELK